MLQENQDGHKIIIDIAIIYSYKPAFNIAKSTLKNYIPSTYMEGEVLAAGSLITARTL